MLKFFFFLSLSLLFLSFLKLCKKNPKKPSFMLTVLTYSKQFQRAVVGNIFTGVKSAVLYPELSFFFWGDPVQCCPSHLISTLIQRDACAGPVAVLWTGINYVFTMSYDQPIFLPFCLCPCAYLHASSMGRRACLYRSFLVSRRGSVGPEELCLLV